APIVPVAGAARLPAGYELEPARVDCLRVAAVGGVERVDGAAGHVHRGDAAAVGRPCGAVVGRVIGDRVLVGAVGVHHPDVAPARVDDVDDAVRVGEVGDLGAVRAPVGHLVFGLRVEGELRLAGAVGVHHVDLRGAGAIAGEDDLAAVGREGGVAVVAGAARQPGEAAAIAPDHVDVPRRRAGRLAGEDDLAPVGREVGEDREPAQVRDLLLVGAVLLHRPDLHGAAALARAVGDPPPVGRVVGAGVEARVGREPAQVLPVRAHRVDVDVAADVDPEGNPPVGCPRVGGAGGSA